MTERDVTIKTSVQGGPQTAEELRAIKDASASIGDGLKDASQGADQFAASSGRIAEIAHETEAAVRKWVDEAGRVVESNDSIDVQRQKLEGLRATLDDTTFIWGKFGDEGKAAAEAASAGLADVNAKIATLGTTSRTSTDAVSEGLRSTATEARNTGQAIEESGRVSRTGYERIDAAVEQVKRSLGELDKKFDSGSKVERDSIDRVISAQLALQREIQRAGVDVQGLGDDFQKEYAQINAEVTRSKDQFRDYNKVLQDQSKELGVAGEQWLGLGDAVTKALGPMGQTVATGGLIVAALKQGWSVGTQFAQSIGTDFSEMNALIDDAKGRLNSFLASLSDTVVAAFSGDAEGLGSALEDVAQSLVLTKNEFAGYRLAIEAGIKSTNDLTTDTKALSTLQANHSQIVKAGTLGFALYKEAVDLAGGDLNALNGILAAAIKQLGAVDSATASVAVATDILTQARKDLAEAYTNEITILPTIVKTYGDIIKALDADAAARKIQFDAYGRLLAQMAPYQAALKAEADLLLKQQDVTNGSTESIRAFEQKIIDLLPQYDAQKQRIDIWTAALKTATESQIGLTKEERAHNATIVTLLESLSTANAVERDAIISQLEWTLAIQNGTTHAEILRATVGKLSRAAADGVPDIHANAQAIAEQQRQADGANTAIGRLHVTVKDGKVVISDQTEATDTSAEAMKDLTDHVDAVVLAQSGFAVAAPSHVKALTDEEIAANKTAVAHQAITDALDANLKKQDEIEAKMRGVAVNVSDEWKKSADSVVAGQEAIQKVLLATVAAAVNYEAAMERASKAGLVAANTAAGQALQQQVNQQRGQ